MFSRFKISLFQPSRIANFQNDTKLTTMLYYFLLVLLATIPSIILIFSTSGLSYESRNFIRNELRDVEIPYEIVDYKLIKKEVNTKEILEIELSETMVAIFTDKLASEVELNPFRLETLFIFSSEEFIFYASPFETIHIKYEEYDIKELDFIGATNNENEFWGVVFPIANEVMIEFAPRNRIINTIILFIVSGVSLLFFSLLIAFLQRVRLISTFKFGKIWQLTIYTMTPYIILTLLSELYGIGILSMIGVMISYFHASKMSMAILKR